MTRYSTNPLQASSSPRAATDQVSRGWKGSSSGWPSAARRSRARIALQRRVGEAGLEHDDLVLAEQLALLDRVLLQLEAEQVADRLGEAFDADHAQGKLRRVAELVRQFRAEHRYA